MNIPLSKYETQTMKQGLLDQRFLCRDHDSIWVGIERALDNGFGVVFVVDDKGVLLGRASLDDMRKAIAKGAHLSTVCMGEIAVRRGLESENHAVTPVLDERSRLIGVDIRSEAGFVPVAEPDLTHLELRNVLDAFLSTWISSTGSYISSFEVLFAETCDMAHGIATANGTVSLHLALTALGIGEGDEVIVPDLTFAASANTVMLTVARPVLVDCDPVTWCMSLEGLKKAITPKTRAIMPVHVFGRPAPMPEIRAIADRHNLFVIEDCAEAHAARIDGQPVGSFSDVSCFSFFANKIVTTGEGGMCLTNDPDLAVRMRMLRDHGMSPERRYWHEEVGFNFRMTNLQAAIGSAQLCRLEHLLAMRRSVFDLYASALDGVPGVTFPPDLPARFQPVTWLPSVLVPVDKRAELIAACRAEKIDLRPFFNSLSAMPAYRRISRPCPVSKSLSRSGVNLPISRKVDVAVVSRVAKIFEGVLGKRKSLTASRPAIRPASIKLPPAGMQKLQM